MIFTDAPGNWQTLENALLTLYKSLTSEEFSGLKQPELDDDKSGGDRSVGAEYKVEGICDSAV